MKRRTVLEIANNVALQLRFDTFTSLVGNESKNAQTILLAINQGLERDVFWYHPWAILRRKMNVSFAEFKDYYVLPTDFDHVINDTSWDVIRKRHAIGPLDPVDWSQLIGSDTPFPDAVTFTIAGYENPGGGIGGSASKTAYQQAIFVYPEPQENSPGPALTIWYVSNEKVAGDNELAKVYITADNDTPVLDADLVEHAAYVRCLRILGLGFADEMAELEANLKTVARRDGGRTRMNMAEASGLPYPNTPGHYPAFRRRGRW